MAEGDRHPSIPAAAEEEEENYQCLLQMSHEFLAAGLLDCDPSVLLLGVGRRCPTGTSTTEHIQSTRGALVASILLALACWPKTRMFL